MNKDIKTVGLVAAGVIVAALVIQYGRGSVPLLQQAHEGFDGLG